MISNLLFIVRSTIFCFLLLFSFSAYSQTTVTIGVGTSSSSGTNTDKPIYSSGSSSSYTHSRFSQITTESQLQAAGINGSTFITQWGYDKTTSGRPANNANGVWTLNVYLKATSATSQSGGTKSWDTMKSGATLVYSNTNVNNSNMPSATGFWMWDLTTPFSYSGSGGIECLIEWIPLNSSSRTTEAIDWRYTDLSPNQCIGTNNNAAISGSSFTFYGNNRYYNTRLTYDCPAVNAFNVTGGGSACANVGSPVGLDNSQIGVSYQLKRDGNNVGSPVAGTGAALSFGNQTVAGVYTVVGTNGCSKVMTGSATITLQTAPINVSAGSDPAAFCTGGSFQLNGTAELPSQIFFENFETGVFPSGWSQTTNSIPVWGITSPTLACNGMNAAMNGSHFMAVCGSGYGFSPALDVNLFSPVFDFTGYSNVEIKFSHRFVRSGNGTARFYYRINSGSWVELTNWTSSTASNPGNYSSGIQAALAGNLVEFRWKYGETNSSFNAGWAIDDIEITGAASPIISWSGGPIVSGANTLTPEVNPATTTTYTMSATFNTCTVEDEVIVTVTPNNTADVASTSPAVLVNTSLPSITHATTGATGIGTSSGLPDGVTADFATNTITISGIPSETGVFNYSIPLTGGCGSVNATGTITVVDISTWTGGADTDWFNQNNWLFGLIPPTGGRVLVAGEADFYPQLTSSISLSDLEVESGASIVISSGNSITITNQFTNDGTISTTPGSYIVTSNVGDDVVVSAVICPLGNFCADGISAQFCPAGSFQNLTGQTSCTECAAGTFQSNTGAINCIACAPGTFASEEGQVECTLCDRGFFSNQSGSIECQPCSAGTYQDQFGSILCIPCAPGTFAADIARTYCEDCLPGSYQPNSGSIECLSCPGQPDFGAVECNNENCATTANINQPELILLCANQTATLVVEFNGEIDNIQWFRNWQPIPGATTASLLANRWTIGDVYAVATCSGDAIQSNTIAVNKVNVLNESGADAHYSKVCVNQPTTFSTPYVAGATYQWRERPNGTLVSTDREYTFSGFTGSFDVFVTSPSGCTRSTRVRVLPENEKNCEETELATRTASKTSLSSIDETVSLMFYPNPVTDKYVISLSGLSEDENFAVSWYDITGKQVKNTEIIATGTGREATQNIGNLAKGIYVVKVDNANHQFTFRVMVQ